MGREERKGERGEKGGEENIWGERERRGKGRKDREIERWRVGDTRRDEV